MVDKVSADVRVELNYIVDRPFWEALSTYRGVKDGERLQKLARRLWFLGHRSPYEFLQFGWRLRLTNVGLRHLARHRTFKIASTSKRVKNEVKINPVSAPEVYPSGFVATSSLGSFIFEKDEKWDKEDRAITFSITGASERDMEVYFVPQWSLYDIYLLTDARNLINFFQQRLSDEAHYEIQNIASGMLALLKEHCGFLDWDKMIGGGKGEVA